MGFFDDHDVDDIPDDPNHLPDNTYAFEVVKAEINPTKDGSKTGIVFRYQILNGEWATFFPLSDWVRVPDKNTESDKVSRILSHLKMRLVGFGFTNDEIQKFSPDNLNDCIGRRFYGTTRSKTNGDRTNISVTKFAKYGEGDVDIDFGDDGEEGTKKAPF